MRKMLLGIAATGLFASFAGGCVVVHERVKDTDERDKRDLEHRIHCLETQPSQKCPELERQVDELHAIVQELERENEELRERLEE